MPEAPLAVTIRWESVGTLLLMSLAIMGSPGPATISLLAAGSAHGLRRCLPYLLGIIGGTVVVLVAVASGVTAALLAVPAIGTVLVWISAAYVLWLGVRIATSPPLSEPAQARGAYSLAGGTLLGVANPKGWVAIAAVFASTHLTGGATADAIAKLAVLVPMVVVICTTWLLVGASIAPLLRDSRRGRLVNVALAVAVVGATALAVLH